MCKNGNVNVCVFYHTLFYIAAKWTDDIFKMVCHRLVGPCWMAQKQKNGEC